MLAASGRVRASEARTAIRSASGGSGTASASSGSADPVEGTSSVASAPVAPSTPAPVQTSAESPDTMARLRDAKRRARDR
jgi:hypothetical protein